MLYGITENNIDHLQRIQSALARVVCGAPHRLQWIFDIHYIGCPTELCLQSDYDDRQGPATPATTVSLWICRQRTAADTAFVREDCWSNPEPRLIVSRSFRSAAPHVWSSLQPFERFATSIEIFVSKYSSLTSPIMIINDLSHSAPRTCSMETNMPSGSAAKVMASSKFKTNLIWFDRLDLYKFWVWSN